MQQPSRTARSPVTQYTAQMQRRQALAKLKNSRPAVSEHLLHKAEPRG
jgi:hypothetical protein